jgi:glutamine amidotransferase
MSRVLALIGNRPNLCALIAKHYSRLLQVRTHGKALGWGIGFYQAGEALLRRRPLDDREVIEIGALNDVSTSLLLAQVRTPGVGSLRTENTPPFRYRNLLFAQRGNIQGFTAIKTELLESQPEFLRCNLRGETDGELLFYSVLACLDEADGLEGDLLAPARVRQAMREAITRLDAALARTGHPPADVDWFLADGDHVVSLHRTALGAHRHFESLDELSDLLPDSRPDLSRKPFSCSIMTSGIEELPDERWQPIAAGSLVTLSRTEPALLEPL